MEAENAAARDMMLDESLMATEIVADHNRRTG